MKDEQVQFKPGWGTWFSNRNETLRLLTHRSITSIRPWGLRAGAWRKTANSYGWKPLRPNISLDPKQSRLSYKYAQS